MAADCTLDPVVIGVVDKARVEATAADNGTGILIVISGFCSYASIATLSRYRSLFGSIGVRYSIAV